MLLSVGTPAETQKMRFLNSNQPRQPHTTPRSGENITDADALATRAVKTKKSKFSRKSDNSDKSINFSSAKLFQQARTVFLNSKNQFIRSYHFPTRAESLTSDFVSDDFFQSSEVQQQFFGFVRSASAQSFVSNRDILQGDNSQDQLNEIDDQSERYTKTAANRDAMVLFNIWHTVRDEDVFQGVIEQDAAVARVLKKRRISVC